MTRPVLLDLFCGAGGAAVGYHRAGFDIIGVDAADQPRYPFEWYKGDALGLLPELIDRYRPDAIHASPPCQDHSTLAALAGAHGTGWLLDASRQALAHAGIPYVIENVAGADMAAHLTLCGGMFGLRTYRHRKFELGGWLAWQPSHPKHRVRVCTRNRRAGWDAGLHASVTGDIGVYVGPEAMGIDWMTGAELSQAIPPAYTEFIGEQLMARLRTEVPA